MLCGSLDGRGSWGRMDTCICMVESLHCSPETITTLLIGHTLIQSKKFRKKDSPCEVLLNLLDVTMVLYLCEKKVFPLRFIQKKKKSKNETEE